MYKADYVETLRQSLQVYVNKPVDPPRIEQDLTRITGTGVIRSANYAIIDKEGVPGLQAIEHDKVYAPPFLHLAVNIDGSDPDNVLFGMAARLTFIDLGGYRAEWRNDAFFGSSYGVRSEYYRPFADKTRWFYAPHIYAVSAPFNIYEGQDRLAQYRLERDGFGMDVGYTLSPRSEIRVGEDLFWFKSIKKITDDPIPNTTEREALSSVRYRYLGVDNIELPRQGLNVESSFGRYVLEAGLESFSQAELHATYFQRISEPGSLIFSASGGTSFNASSLDLLLQSFSLGGPFRLGSYGQNELLGTKYFLFQAGYEHKLLPFSPLLGEGLYALTLMEAGKMYDPLNIFTAATPVDGSAVLVARTSLGPIYIGASFGSESHRKWWFGIGRIF